MIFSLTSISIDQLIMQYLRDVLFFMIMLNFKKCTEIFLNFSQKLVLFDTLATGSSTMLFLNKIASSFVTNDLQILILSFLVVERMPE